MDEIMATFDRCGQDVGQLCAQLGLPPAMADVVQTALAEAGEDTDVEHVLQRTMALAMERIGALAGAARGTADEDVKDASEADGQSAASAELKGKMDELLAQLVASSGVGDGVGDGAVGGDADGGVHD
jgi:hypothetical protein